MIVICKTGQGCALKGKIPFFKMLKIVYRQGKWDHEFSSNVKMSVEKVQKEKKKKHVFFFLRLSGRNIEIL